MTQAQSPAHQVDIFFVPHAVDEEEPVQSPRHIDDKSLTMFITNPMYLKIQCCRELRIRKMDASMQLNSSPWLSAFFPQVSALCGSLQQPQEAALLGKGFRIWRLNQRLVEKNGAWDCCDQLRLWNFYPNSNWLWTGPYLECSLNEKESLAGWALKNRGVVWVKRATQNLGQNYPPFGPTSNPNPTCNCGEL